MTMQLLQQEETIAYKRGARAFREGKTARACPYNGPQLRDDWNAGYAAAADKRIKELAKGRK